MGKSRKQQIMEQEYQYDEASSESDSDSDDEDGNDDEMMQSSSGGHRRDDCASDDDNSGEDEDEERNDSDSESEDDGNDEDDDDGKDQTRDSEDDESSSDEEDVPLHERLLKNEGRGIRKQTRERKSKALEEATKRLASFRQNQKRKTSTEEESKNEENPKKKKKNKHKPTEVSSKRAAFYSRGAWKANESGLGVDIGAHRYKPNDPRINSLSGHFDQDRFHSNYAFLEEVRNKEIGQVRKRIAAHKATGNKGNRLRRKVGIIQADGSHSSTLDEDVERLKSLTQARADLERQKIDRAAKKSVKRQIREKVESGQSGAYFLKRKEQRRLELEARFEEIRKRGGDNAVEKVLAKKRKKNKSRDASFLSR